MTTKQLFNHINSNDPKSWEEASNYLSVNTSFDEEYRLQLQKELLNTSAIPCELLLPYFAPIYHKLLAKVKEVFDIEVV